MEASVTARTTDAKGDVSAVTIPGASIQWCRPRGRPCVAAELIRSFEVTPYQRTGATPLKNEIIATCCTNAAFLPNDIRS